MIGRGRCDARWGSERMRRLRPGTSKKKEKSVTDSLMSADELKGLRILVVEDEAAISLLLEDMLLDFGCEVIGPAARLSAALEAVARETRRRHPRRERRGRADLPGRRGHLDAVRIPFVFSTGYGSAGIKDAFRDRPVLQKPFAQNDLKVKLLLAWENGKPAA